MKFVLILATLFVASNSLDKEFLDELVKQIKEIGEECITETSATKEDLESLFDHKIPESHEGKCMLFCLHKRFNLQNEDGSLNKHGAVEALEPLRSNDPELHNKVLKIFSTCADTAPVDSDPCIYATNLAQCCIKEAKDAGLTELLVIE